MSCPRERELALYVEDDLPVSEIAALQAHVLDCGVCRGFLISLEASQRALKDLAAQPVPDEALAILRSRATALPAVHRRSVRLRWAAAAAVAAALLPGAFLAVARLRAPAPAADPTRVATETAKGPFVTGVGAAFPKTPAAVSKPAMANLPHKSLVVEADLTPEEVVELAKAVVAVANIRSVEDVDLPVEGASQEPVVDETPLVRMATDDPNVVIYWRMEPSGGK